MITRLSGADAVSLHTQTPTTPAQTVALVVIDASDQLSHERLHRLVASSLPQLALFRSRLMGKPLGMGQPVWAEIVDYDPTSQIHSATVDAPGGEHEFADLIAQLSTGRRGHREPLWEAWSIDGLAGGRWALAVKMSPALNDDGAGPPSMWPRLLTTGRHDDPANQLPTETSLGTPSLGELVTDAVTEIVENQVTGVWLVAEAVTGALRAARRRLRDTNEPDPTPATSSMSGPVPHTVFNAPLTARRAVAFASVPLADLRTVSAAFGSNTANVLLAACTLSLRAWLQHHDTVPDGPLLMQVPLSLPHSDPATSGGPPASVRQIRLPVQLHDPVQILTELHTATERVNTDGRLSGEKADSTIDFATVASLIPPPVFRAGMRLYTGLGLKQRRAPICHGSVSYTSVEPVTAYCAGAKVHGVHTVAPLRDGCGLNITATSHGDEMDLCLCVCPDTVPAVDEIASGIAKSVEVLVAAAREAPRGQGRSVVTEMTSHTTQRSHGHQ